MRKRRGVVGELNASMYKWSQLQNYLSLRLPITSRHHDKWPPVTMVSTRKKCIWVKSWYQLGACQNIANKLLSLCCFTTLLIWRLNLYSSAKCVFNKSRTDRAVMAAPVFNLGEKSEIRDFVCKCETGTEKLTCKLGTLFAQTHFYSMGSTKL